MDIEPLNIIEVNLSPEEIEELERLSALGYSHQQMAMYFRVDLKLFLSAAENPRSKINYHIQRGQLVSIAREQMAILTSAEGGNITAHQQLEKIRRTRGFEISKLDIFGGIDDQKTYQKLEDFIQSEGKTDLSNEETVYLEALSMMNSMDRKYGRRNTIAFFTKPPFNLKHSRASEMYDEALNLFYTDRNIDKKALRHKKAEQLDEAAHVMRLNASCAKDFEVYGDLVMKSAKLLQLDQKDPEPLSKELYLRPVRVFSLDPQAVGIPAINRQSVAAQIDELEIPERDKIRVRRDAMLETIPLEDILNELEEESKVG